MEGQTTLCSIKTPYESGLPLTLPLLLFTQKRGLVLTVEQECMGTRGCPQDVSL